MELTPQARALYDLDVLFKSLPGVRSETLTLIEVLEREAEALRLQHAARAPAAAALLRITRWQRGRPADADDAIFAAPLTAAQAREDIARWHWFAGWAEVQAQAGELVDPRFEAAADAIVAGDADALRALLAADPALVRARSPYGHHAMLLHYVAANGVEANRQWQSPANAVQIAEILLAAGADVNATCEPYGPGCTTLGLVVTSAHPAVAGVQADLAETLCRAGADPDGPGDNGGPLWDAISSGYTAAAERLVRCGARVDNLIVAAALGDLAIVQSYFDASGRLDLERAQDWGKTFLAKMDREHPLEYALINAAGHGRREIVEFLLGKDPDLGVVEPIWKNTALDAAEYGRHTEIIALLRARSSIR